MLYPTELLALSTQDSILCRPLKSRRTDAITSAPKLESSCLNGSAPSSMACGT